MTKRIVTLLLAVLFVLSSTLLVACGSSETEKTNPTTTPAKTEESTTPATTGESQTPVVTDPTETEPTVTEPTETEPTETEPTETEPTETEPTETDPTETESTTPAGEVLDISVLESDPQTYLKWLIDDDGDNSPMLWGGGPYNCKHAGAEEGCPWETWPAEGDIHFHMTYQFDKFELDASEGHGTEDYGFLFQIWYKDDDVDEPYKSTEKFAPWSIYIWGGDNTNVIYRMQTYTAGMTDLHTDDGATNEYEMVFMIFDLDGNLLGWKQAWVPVTDSYEMYIEDALNLGIIE